MFVLFLTYSGFSNDSTVTIENIIEIRNRSNYSIWYKYLVKIFPFKVKNKLLPCRNLEYYAIVVINFCF